MLNRTFKYPFALHTPNVPKWVLIPMDLFPEHSFLPNTLEMLG